MNILVKMPTTHRWAAAMRQLQAWHDTESGRHAVRYQITADAGEKADAQKAVELLRAAGVGIDLHLCDSAGKVHACNAGLDGAAPWDGMVLASDDFIPELFGWDDCIAGAMAWNHPAMDGVLHFHDGYMGGRRLMTLPILGMNFFRRFGYVYHPRYRSFFCDNELTEVAQRMGKYAWIDLVLARHAHGGASGDAVYAANQRHHADDRLLFARRRTAGFDLKMADLSILIPTLWCRRQSAAQLLTEIYRQIWALPDPSRVEVQTLLDQQEWTVGQKRNALLRTARGRYVCFVDDDDTLAADYAASLLSAIDAAPEADAVVFRGQYYVDGEAALAFDFDLKYRAYRNTSVLYERTPNHLCPVKRQLSLQARFDESNCGEDIAYAKRLRPLLRTQAICRDARGDKKLLYHYRFSPSGTMTQRRV